MILFVLAGIGNKSHSVELSMTIDYWKCIISPKFYLSDQVTVSFWAFCTRESKILHSSIFSTSLPQSIFPKTSHTIGMTTLSRRVSKLDWSWGCSLQDREVVRQWDWWCKLFCAPQHCVVRYRLSVTPLCIDVKSIQYFGFPRWPKLMHCLIDFQAVRFYNWDGRSRCLATGGNKLAVKEFKQYLVIVRGSK